MLPFWQDPERPAQRSRRGDCRPRYLRLRAREWLQGKDAHLSRRQYVEAFPISRTKQAIDQTSQSLAGNSQTPDCSPTNTQQQASTSTSPTSTEATPSPSTSSTRSSPPSQSATPAPRSRTQRPRQTSARPSVPGYSSTARPSPDRSSRASFALSV